MTDTDQSTSDADSQTESVTPIKSIVYDEVGDLTIRVGRRLYPHRVDSKSLSRSSPVFKKMLFGGFVESRPSNEKDWVVDLPEDERHSMRIVFRIMHGAFKKVPTKLPLEDLYDLLAHTEKYDATHLLRPWAKDWVKAVKDQTQEPELLCVAWELGDSHLFRQMMVIIINKCHVNGRGNVVYGRQTRGFNFRYPISGKMCLNPPTFSFEWLEHIKPPNIEGKQDLVLYVAFHSHHQQDYRSLK
ncbi:hypothetical protein LX32DRAFT_561508 [Colletotrichum zoysiae]|uniref:BTB domain-containing protein n=1 Tax=Colletotrichum zoysiae TaxID=1216348 RepID=A0AAD9M047_9PEZI|nr:hypothetical protein LX32DRAFT_561508 [Colletotrichum zoysiae]